MNRHPNERYRDSYDRHVLREAIATMFFPLRMIISIAALPAGIVATTTVARIWTASSLCQWLREQAIQSRSGATISGILSLIELAAIILLLLLPSFLAMFLLGRLHRLVQRKVAEGLWSLRGPDRSGYSRDFNPAIVILLPFLSRVIIFATAIATIVVVPAVWIWFLGP